MAFSTTAFGGGGVSAFLFTSVNQERTPGPVFIPIDLSVLALANPLPTSAFGFDTQPTIVPPWLQQQSQPTLARRINEVRALASFIDENAPGVDTVGASDDAKATFILFDALSKLETLAQYASEATTPDASLDRLDAQFQSGLAEIRDYITTTQLENITFLTGESTHNATAAATLGSDQETFTGRSVATGTRDDPLPGLTGTETFTLSITHLGTPTDITIDLSKITGPLSINAVVDLVNNEITAIPALDANGQPILDANGQPVPKFSTRFAVVSDANFDHAIEIQTTLLEEVTLKPAASDPASLYLATNRSPVTGSDPDSTRVTRLDDIAGLISEGRRIDVAGTDARATAIATASATDPTTVEPVAAPTRSDAIAVDSEGSIYVVGTSSGDFGSQLNTTPDGAEDVFLTKLDSNGNVVFSRLLGSSTGADAFSIAIDGSDNVVIAGTTADNLAPGSTVPGTDSFIAKFSKTGDRLFTYQLDTFAEDGVADLAVDANGNIFATGFTSGALDAATPSNGGRDTVLLRIDGTTGTLADKTVIGTAGDERGQAIAVANDGNILVAAREDGRAVLRKLDVTNLSNVLLTQDLGSIGLTGAIRDLAVSGTDIFLAGDTEDATFTGGAATVATAAAGGGDAFLLKLTDQGTSVSADTISFVGTTAKESADEIVVNGSSVFLAGTTGGDLGGSGRTGATDGFVARLNATTGLIEQVDQFGILLSGTGASGLALAPGGDSVLDKLGLPLGTVDRLETRDLETQTTARVGDYFEVAINGGTPQRITLEAGDDLDDIARKLKRLSLTSVLDATVTAGELEISALDSNRIDLIAGPAGKDLLARIGLTPQRLVGLDALLELDTGSSSSSKTTEPDIGGNFALRLDQPLSLANKTAAQFTLTQIQDAIETTKRAFRSLTPSPLPDPALSGPVPREISKQLANYSDALLRLQFASFGGGGGVLI